MISKIKKALGIEGVKIKIDMPVEQEKASGNITFTLLFTTKYEQLVKYVDVKLIETYTRGRRKAKRIDEYTLGEMRIDLDLTVSPDIEITRELELPVEFLHSGIDTFQNKNIIYKALGAAAKLAKNAKSSYILQCNAKVTGTALNPHAEREIYFL